jgi:hypothetical protein
MMPSLEPTHERNPMAQGASAQRRKSGMVERDSTLPFLLNPL